MAEIVEEARNPRCGGGAGAQPREGGASSARASVAGRPRQRVIAWTLDATFPRDGAMALLGFRACCVPNTSYGGTVSGPIGGNAGVQHMHARGFIVMTPEPQRARESGVTHRQRLAPSDRSPGAAGEHWRLEPCWSSLGVTPIGDGADTQD